MWAYDFVHIGPWDGRAVRLLTVIDEYTRECLAIRTGRSIRSPDVIKNPRRADDSQGSAGAHSLGQRTRVHCQGCP